MKKLSLIPLFFIIEFVIGSGRNSIIDDTLRDDQQETVEEMRNRAKELESHEVKFKCYRSDKPMIGAFEDDDDTPVINNTWPTVMLIEVLKSDGVESGFQPTLVEALGKSHWGEDKQFNLIRVYCRSTIFEATVLPFGSYKGAVTKIRKYIQDNSLRYKTMHIIGWAEGANIAGYLPLSRYENEDSAPRVVALDPSFSNPYGLSESVADHLLVIHTNGDKMGHFEPSTPVGPAVQFRSRHLDIYLNGGYVQPHCPSNNEDNGECSHRYAWVYFAENINKEVEMTQCSHIDRIRDGMCFLGPRDKFRLFGNCLEVGIFSILTNKFDSRSILLKFNAIRDVEFKLIVPEYFGNNRLNLHEQQLTFENLEKDFENSGFDKSKPTVIGIHGFNGGGLVDGDFSKSYFPQSEHKKRDVNLIAVDWSKGARLPFYNIAMRLTQCVADFTNLFIRKAIEIGQFTIGNNNLIEKIELVGHSLGAHTCGFVGKFLQMSKNYYKLPKIVALDPAGPGFSDYWRRTKLNRVVNAHVPERLHESDADRVMVIHTQVVSYGCGEPLGHFDIYLNGGSLQPTRRLPDFTRWLRSKIGIFEIIIPYSHSFVNEYFLALINVPHGIEANCCEDTGKAMWDELRQNCTKSEYKTLFYINGPGEQWAFRTIHVNNTGPYNALPHPICRKVYKEARRVSTIAF